jgi:hypothetical protein
LGLATAGVEFVAKEMGTEQSPANWQEILAIETRKFADRLKKVFSAEISQNAVNFKKSVVRLIRPLPPRPGRRNDPRIDAAILLLKQGKTLRDVLRIQIPGFEQMDPYTQILADRGLRKSLAARGIRFRKEGIRRHLHKLIGDRSARRSSPPAG